MGGYLEKLKSIKSATHGTAKTAKRTFYSKYSDRDRHISEKKPKIPSPEPAKMGPEYTRLWNRAWELAEWIDDPAAAPIEERRAKLPELDNLRDRMAAIYSNGTNKPVPPAAPEPETSPPDTWHPWNSNGVARDTNPESCPARCRRSGKCYSRAYFKGKPGKVKDCEPENCPHT